MSVISACQGSGVMSLRANLCEFAAEQNQPQQMAKNDAFLFHHVARLHILVEVPLEPQQLGGAQTG